MKRVALLFSLLLFFTTGSLGRTITLNPSIAVEKQMIYPNTTYLVNTTIDCKGKGIEMPANCALSIKSGSLRNGYLRLSAKSQNASISRMNRSLIYS